MAGISAQIAEILPGIVYRSIYYPDGTVRCVFVNDAVKSITGLSPRTVLRDSRSFNNLLHPEDRPWVEKAWMEHTLSPRPWTQQYRLLIPKKGVRWVQSVAHIEREPGGETSWTGFITDITDIKLAEEALQISEERISLAARAGKVGLWDYDFLTHEIVWNETQYEIHGVRPDSYRPNLERNSKFIHPEDVPRVEAVFQKCIESGAHEYEAECRIIRADGEVRITKSNAFIIRNDKGQPVRAVGTEVDITEERRVMETLAKAREDAEAATRAKSEFLARMSHEIRTPMNAIIAPAQMLAANAETPTQRELASMIVNSGEHLMHIINDILDFSKLEAGKMRLAAEPFCIDDLVPEILGLMSVLARKKHIELTSTISPAAHGHWIGDAARIKQILFNFLSNAIKFTHHGKVSVHIRTQGRSSSQPALRFEVQDTGQGIDAESQQTLFQPFEQGRRVKPDQSGTGLGLAICRDLVEVMGGRIGFESAARRGSSFWFTIPLQRCADAPKTSRPSRACTQTPSHLAAHILVAEDNASNRKVLSLLLKQLGCTSEHANNGRQAVERFREGSYDLILMDYEMPVMTGVEASREILRLAGKKPHPPIIALTAHVSPEHRDACLQAGMDAVLSKPITLDKLREALIGWLPSRSLQTPPASLHIRHTSRP